MIVGNSHSREWIMSIRETSPGKDPILVEKMIMALTLLEHLRLNGLQFTFKGGTSLLLLLDTPQRFSIDIDILLPNDTGLETCFQRVIGQGAFQRVEENRRPGDLPKAHYKFFFNSVIQNKESQVLLDILFEENPYPLVRDVDLASPLLFTEGTPTKVTCPTIECLLGDKLTAFAPHTTGIQLGVGKELEIAKQLFDIGILFDAAQNIGLVGATFEKIVSHELAYRKLHLTHLDVLKDILATCFTVGMRGAIFQPEYSEMLEGFKKMAAFVYSGNFTLDTAILCASKAAFLSALLVKKKTYIPRFTNPGVIATWNIVNPEYNKLNKLKKTSPEAFYYYFKALEMLEHDQE